MIEHLDIAGIVIRLDDTSSASGLRLPAEYHAFRTDPVADGDACYQVLPPDTPRLPPITVAPPIWSSDIWRMGLTDTGRTAIEIRDVIRSRWVPVAEVGPDFRQGTLQPFAGRRAAPSSDLLNYPVDQVLLINRLLECGILVLHAAAVSIEGRGLVFGGRSGIGKTTLSRRCRDHGATLINDDRCALFMRHGIPWVSATPWHGEDPEINRITVPLAGIFHLRQAADNRITPIPDGLDLARLAATAILPYYRQAGVARATGVMDEIAAGTPSFVFDFRPDESAWHTLRGYLDSM